MIIDKNVNSGIIHISNGKLYIVNMTDQQEQGATNYPNGLSPSVHKLGGMFRGSIEN